MAEEAAGSGPPPGAGGSHVAHLLLDSAAEHFIVSRDFQAAFGICEKGLSVVEEHEREDCRCGEVKEGLCILGVQALAELDQWPAVLAWVLRQYERPEEIPAHIMQMCILLYSKVGHEAAIQEAARLWLFCPATAGLAAYRTVAELYLLCVLLPLGRTDDARQLVLGEVGGRAFSEDQRRLALEVVAEKEEAECRESPLDDGRHRPSPGVPVPTQAPGGALRDKLQAMLRLLCRSLSPSGASGWSALRRLVMAVALVYILVIHMNPALPPSYLWINKLVQLLKQMWNVMFKPHYSA